MVWAKSLTQTMASATTSDTLSVTAYTFMQIIGHTLSNNHIAIQNGSTTVDTGANYAQRNSGNGGADGTGTSVSYGQLVWGSGDAVRDAFYVQYMINIAGEEKLTISHSLDQGASGAGTAPNRSECVGKWVNTSNQADQIKLNDINASGNFAISTNTTVLGTD
jgi:hypothetical protein